MVRQDSVCVYVSVWVCGCACSMWDFLAGLFSFVSCLAGVDDIRRTPLEESLVAHALM